MVMATSRSVIKNYSMAFGIKPRHLKPHYISPAAE
jgi:hypothetical protein